jgi:hypothetical protein
MIRPIDQVFGFSLRLKSKPDLVGVLIDPAIDTVVGGVECTFGEPSDVSVLETSSPDGMERAVPVKSVACHLKFQ